MSKFNVRPIPPPPPPTVSVPRDRKPTAYSAMKGGGDVISHVGTPGTGAVAVAVAVEEKKRGRPSKDELRKHKLAMASAGINILMTSKPTRKKIHEYMERRILELEMEKR